MNQLPALHSLRIPPTVMEMIRAIAEAGGNAVLVGGATRDAILGKPIKDFDIEVYGIPTYAHLHTLLKNFGLVHEVGKSFGVVKVKAGDLEVDFAFPRTESKISAGHKGFEVTPNPNLDFKTAASRRDFTMNAIGLDLMTGEWLDPFDGASDIMAKKIRHIGPAFSEDPLRVLRAMQFAARFGFDIVPETVALCRELDLSELAPERCFEEFKKVLLLAETPSIGFEWARKMGVLTYYPEIEALIGTPQDPEWHPEGDVWVHTLMVLDEMAKLRPNDLDEALILMLAALCHDLGKPPTTAFIDGRWRSRGHEVAGVAPTEAFLRKLTQQSKLIEAVCVLVKEHLKPGLLYKSEQIDGVSDAAIKRLVLRVPVQRLLVLAQADHFGRTTPDALAREFEAGDWLRTRLTALNLGDTVPEPLILGRDLLVLGVSPGPRLGLFLKELFDAQLDGKFQNKEEGLSYFKTIHPKLG